MEKLFSLNSLFVILVLLLFTACGDDVEVDRICDTAPRINDSFCEQGTYTLPDGFIVSVPGDYDVFLGAEGDCNEAVVYSLTTFSIEDEAVEVIICEGESYTLPNGESVSEPGIYPVTVERDGTCNLRVTTTLIIQDDAVTEVEVVKCPDSEYILPDGTAVTAEGTYIVTVNSSAGCDSNINTTIINDVSVEVEVQVNAEICLGDTYTLPSGGMITPSETGTTNYLATFLTPSGCDSVVRTILTVHPTFESEESVTISSGQTYTLPDGTVVDQAGTYTTTLQTVNNCDSVIITNLSIN